jgi:hypothetical protein
MPVVFVANQTSGKAIFVDESQNIQIEWDGAGDSVGNDVQPCPDSILQNAQFLKHQRKGIFKILSETEADSKLELQARDWQIRQARDANASTEFLDTAYRGNDTITIPCIGPGASSASRFCEEPVLVVERNLGDVPPLCNRHASMKDSFAPYSDPNAPLRPDGQPATQWTPVKFG